MAHGFSDIVRLIARESTSLQLGEPPMKYLTRWRMHIATRLLKNDVKMEKIALQLGYASEVAFRKAFRREVGMPPARYRKLGENLASTLGVDTKDMNQLMGTTGSFYSR